MFSFLSPFKDEVSFVYAFIIKNAQDFINYLCDKNFNNFDTFYSQRPRF